MAALFLHDFVHNVVSKIAYQPSAEPINSYSSWQNRPENTSSTI